MKVMLVEPFGSGHHMSLHIRFAVKKLQSLNCELSLLTRRSAVTDPSFQTVKCYFLLSDVICMKFIIIINFFILSRIYHDIVPALI